ncbi:short chain dehydrogenase family protein [Lyngbya aestuarii BL J]|uniref:Short chain dehydrogenase family protein n=1 Tax=Lyngbya aestuarii BL J TaxID=1348334 RepID=U7QIA3_9CYAN|nr:SDR family oxidoreductase [Lyngbya aestuarii]ERT06815.1 short chain dehydrogenase family protein [Lyngbya aestuarii BL J]
MKKTVVITGISGTLGSALGKAYMQQGCHVVGVTRQPDLQGEGYNELCVSPQETLEDAQKLFSYNPDVVILNAGQIETEVGEGGVPLVELVESMNRVNYTWPAIVAVEAAKQKRDQLLDVIAIGSIADGSPSCFGPVYHSGKIALHYYWSGVGPIVYYASDKMIRLRFYRPGVIAGPLAWAPVNRLNEKAYKIRENRVNSAPSADHVAGKIVNWIENSKQWVGTYEEPFSFKIFKYLFALFPNQFYRLQLLGWPRGSKFIKPAEK